MARIRYAVLGLLVGVAAAAPEPAAAQSGGGWWDWALAEVADQVATGTYSSRATSEDPRTLSDILRERIEDARRGGSTTTPRDPRRDGGGIGWPTDTRDRDDDDDDDWDEDDDDRWDDDDRRRDRAGPPFCRNGQGHPVHGRQWCRDKGFGVGTQRRDVRWEDRGWEDIVLGSPRTKDRQRRTVDQRTLGDVLGDVILGRIDGERRRLGGSQPLEGRWLNLRDGGRVLQIRSGSIPIAELTDANGDGRVDMALVPRR